jgi:aldehyde dehydrogenase (NAD+)
MRKTQAPSASIRIGNRALDTGSGGRFEHLNPYTGEPQAGVPLAGPAEVDEAVAAASAAAEGWRRWRGEDRRDVLLRLAGLVAEHRSEFAELAALDNGTPVVAAGFVVDMSVEWIRYYAGWCDKTSGELISTHDTRGELAYTIPQPFGVVGIVITWNGPLLSLGMKVAPALAAGNCVVVKPSEFTPFAPDLFARLAAEAGLPDGVLSMLPGTVAAGEALVAHPEVKLISFTGGPSAARQILAACAARLKPAVVELGGKSANIIFPDAPDLGAACARAVTASIGTVSGQGCAAPTRALVHADIYDEAVELITAAARQQRMGDPFDETTTVGPVVNAAAAHRIAAMLDRARAGAAGRFAVGGGLAGGALEGRNFVEPTVIVDARPDAEITRQEVFGPVLVVLRFTDEDDAIAQANATDYGLAAYIETADVTRVHRMAERLKAGSVAVNGAYVLHPYSPFGGVRTSGYGKEGGRAGLDEYLQYKSVYVI